MEVLAAALLLAVFGNRVVEFFVTPLFEKYDWDKSWLLYVGAIPGVVLSTAAQLNLFATLGVEMPHLVGVIATAVAVGGGANLLHDVFDNPEGH